MIYLLAACAPEEAADSVDLGDPVEPLVLPDVSGVDFPAAFADAVRLAKTVHAGRAWSGHLAALDRRFGDCPNFYAGAPEGADVDMGDEIEGASWADECTTQGGIGYSGYQYWRTEVAVSGDPETPKGQRADATRSLEGNALVDAGGGGVGFELSGEASDAVSLLTTKTGVNWTWSSTVSGTVTGTDSFGQDLAAPGGWRTDLAFTASGGDVSVYEPRGNVYLYDALLHERFDSFEMDLALAGEGALGPDDCALEPRGWIGLRDENAYWYDLVFLPRYDDDVTDTGGDPDYGACDGCGTLYVRGVEAAEIGQVCLDFGFVWAEDPLVPPSLDDYVLSLHSLTSEAP